MDDAGRAEFLNNLGVIYWNTGFFAEAEKTSGEALDKYLKLAETNPAAYLPHLADTLNNLGLLEISNQNYTNACTHLKEALKIREKLALANPAAFDLDLCQTILAIIKLYASAPGSCSPGDIDIPALLPRAVDILKKYPDVPQAQKLLKLVEKYKKALEKAPGNKRT